MLVIYCHQRLAEALHAFDILSAVLFIMLLEEAVLLPAEVEFDGDLPLVGLDMSPLVGVLAVIFG